MALSTQAFHMTIIIQFFLTTALVLGCAQINRRRREILIYAQVLGTSDGLFNIVLNSIAIVFVLHLDNYVDLDLPDRNFFRLATQEQLKRHAARSRSVLLF